MTANLPGRGRDADAVDPGANQATSGRAVHTHSDVGRTVALEGLGTVVGAGSGVDRVDRQGAGSEDRTRARDDLVSVRRHSDADQKAVTKTDFRRRQRVDDAGSAVEHNGRRGLLRRERNRRTGAGDNIALGEFKSGIVTLLDVGNAGKPEILTHQPRAVDSSCVRHLSMI